MSCVSFAEAGMETTERAAVFNSSQQHAPSALLHEEQRAMEK